MKLQTKFSRVIEYEVPSYYKSNYNDYYFRITADGITKVYDTMLYFIPSDESNSYFEEIADIVDRCKQVSDKEYLLKAQETLNTFKNII
jgi:hypothetical protein